MKDTPKKTKYTYKDFPKEAEEYAKNYRGFKTDWVHCMNTKVPECPECGSANTAQVHVGIISRTIHLSAYCPKFKLGGANAKDKKGDFYCNACGAYFESPHKAELIKLLLEHSDLSPETAAELTKMIMNRLWRWNVIDGFL